MRALRAAAWAGDAGHLCNAALRELFAVAPLSERRSVPRARFAHALDTAAQAFPERRALLDALRAPGAPAGFVRRSVVGQVRSAVEGLGLELPSASEETKGRWGNRVREAARAVQKERWERALHEKTSMAVWAKVLPGRDWIEQHILRQPSDERGRSAQLLAVLGGVARWAPRERGRLVGRPAVGVVPGTWCDLCWQTEAVTRRGRGGGPAG